jgi:DNA-binding ferritin-like protein
MPPQQLLLIFATQLRTIQICSHQSHNMCSKFSFFGDHEFLGSYYSEADGQYDSVAERIIGLFGALALPLSTIMSIVLDKCKIFPSSDFKDNKELFLALLKQEEELQQIGEAYIKANPPEGCKNLVADILDKSMIRIYKLKQRTKN